LLRVRLAHRQRLKRLSCTLEVELEIVTADDNSPAIARTVISRGVELCRGRIHHRLSNNALRDEDADGEEECVEEVGSRETNRHG
jgi:hypothetical protein